MRRNQTIGKYVTALTKVAIQLRQASGGSIAGFERANSIPRGYQSKIENGDIFEPNQAYLEILSRLAGRTVEDLRSLIGMNSKSRSFKLGVGHVVWASPVLLAAWHDRTGAFRVFSYAEG